MNIKIFLTALAVCAVAGLGVQASADQTNPTGSGQPDRGDNSRGGGDHRGNDRGDHRGDRPNPNQPGMTVCSAQNTATGASYTGTGVGSAAAQSSALSQCQSISGSQCVITSCN